MSKEKSNKSTNTNNTNQVVIIMLAIGLVASLVFSIVAFAQTNSLNNSFNTFIEDQNAAPAVDNTEPSENNDPVENNEPVEEVATNCVYGDIDLASDPSYGNPNAPVTIVEYSDFECPFCGRFVTGAYPRIRSEYIDSGQVRIVFKDFPLDNIHPLAIPTALVANCVYTELGDDAFFAYHDRVFLQQSSLSERNIQNWARDLGLSDERINSCLVDSSMRDEILADRNEGIDLGINGTPSFVVNGELLVGAQPFEVFQNTIERALAGNSVCEI